MNEQDRLAERFEAHREHLRGVGYRMLGSPNEADDAVQEAWLRLARTDVSAVANLAGWLTTVVSRICLDMLRSRAARREDLVDEVVTAHEATGPEEEALLVESVGRALLVVLDTLGPAERVAFVLHDMFAVPFDEIAPIVERTTVATKKLASRARRRVRGTPTVGTVGAAELARHRRLVETFLAASRAGDLEAVIAVLAPDVVRRADRFAVPADRPAEVRGARPVAGEIVAFGRNAGVAALALIGGSVGIVVAPHGRLRMAITFTITDGVISAYELIADPQRLRQLELAIVATTSPN